MMTMHQPIAHSGETAPRDFGVSLMLAAVPYPGGGFSSDDEQVAQSRLFLPVLLKLSYVVTAKDTDSILSGRLHIGQVLM